MSAAQAYLGARMDEIPARTPRGNEIIRRDPREIPRRLRGLLLAIDGRQPTHTYLTKLEGFGDVTELLWELITLDLVELRGRARRSANGNGGAEDSALDVSSGGYTQLDALLEDESRAFQTFAESTLTGTFDDLVRVAQADNRAYRPPAPPPPTRADSADVKKQVESLFNLLESVRGERNHLKERLASSQKYRERARRLYEDNSRLSRTIYLLSGTCASLGLALVLALVRR